MSVNFYLFNNSINLYEKAYKILLNIISKSQKPNILIAGGNSLKKIFSIIVNKKINMKNINLLLTDERIVSIKSKYSNSLMVKKFLINKMEEGSKPNFIYPAITNINEANSTIVKKYNNKINLLPNLALIGVGHDGHVASVFFEDVNTLYSKSPTFICKRKNEKFKRISVNINYLINIPIIVIVISGKEKGGILKKIINYKKSKFNFPILQLLRQSKGKINILYEKKLLY